MLAFAARCLSAGTTAPWVFHQGSQRRELVPPLSHLMEQREGQGSAKHVAFDLCLVLYLLGRFCLFRAPAPDNIALKGVLFVANAPKKKRVIACLALASAGYRKGPSKFQILRAGGLGSFIVPKRSLVVVAAVAL